MPLKPEMSENKLNKMKLMENTEHSTEETEIIIQTVSCFHSWVVLSIHHLLNCGWTGLHPSEGVFTPDSIHCMNTIMFLLHYTYLTPLGSVSHFVEAHQTTLYARYWSPVVAASCLWSAWLNLKPTGHKTGLNTSVKIYWTGSFYCLCDIVMASSYSTILEANLKP